MGIRTLCSGCIAAALTLTGCYAGADTEDADFRDGAGDEEFWEIGLGNPANGDTQVSADDDVSPFDLIWDVSGGTTSQTVDEGTGIPITQIIRETVDDEILDGSGNLLCTAVQSQDGTRRAFQLLDANGDAILTLWHRYVFAGDVHIPAEGWKLGDLIKHDTLVSFDQNGIYAGAHWNGELAATADVQVASANPMRKLELASLVAGECGSAGI